MNIPVTDEDIANEILKQGGVEENDAYNAALSTLRFIRYNHLESVGESWVLR